MEAVAQRKANIRSSSSANSAPLDVVARPILGNGGRHQSEQTYIPEYADPLVASEQKTYTHEGKNNFRARNVVAIVDACFDETQITHRENRSTCSPDSASLSATARPPAIALRADSCRTGEAKNPSIDAEGKSRLRDAGFNLCEEFAPTLDTSAPHFVFNADPLAISLRGREGGNMPEIEPDPVVPALRTGEGGSGNPMILVSYVRRLTPRECERLQGFPDDYTLIERKGKPAKDTPRYRALGNSMAVPVIRWIGERINEVSK